MSYQDVLQLCKGIPHSVLQQRCKEEHFGLISRNFKWRTVAPFLPLTEQQIEDILFDGRSEQERRILALQTWMHTMGDLATYGCLMRALLQSSLKDQALHVMVVLLRSCAVPCRHSSVGSNDEEFLTPPQTPPRPQRSRQTQTEESLGASVPSPPTVEAASRSSTRRVVNQYVPLPPPRAQGAEQAAKAFLSTSCTRLPFKDCGTQTDATPPQAIKSRPLPPLPHPLPALPHPPYSAPSQSQPRPPSVQSDTLHDRPVTPMEFESGSSGNRSGITLTYTRRKFCCFLVIPLTIIIGLLLLGMAMIYGIVYALET